MDKSPHLVLYQAFRRCLNCDPTCIHLHIWNYFFANLMDSPTNSARNWFQFVRNDRMSLGKHSMFSVSEVAECCMQCAFGPCLNVPIDVTEWSPRWVGLDTRVT